MQYNTVIAYLRMHVVNREFTLKSCVARNRVTLRVALQFTPGPNNTRWTGRQPKQLKWKETEVSIRSPAHPPTTANIQLGPYAWVDH